MFRKYDHVERWGHPDTEGIEIGTVHVFPKLDGTNASVWKVSDAQNVKIGCGSRTREVGIYDENGWRDNAGFAKWAQQNQAFIDLFTQFPEWHLYGEWLVPHTLRTYRDEAWHRFYVFDVYDKTQNKYIPIEDYKEVLSNFNIDLIDSLCIFNNPTEEQLRREVEHNYYLIKDGHGAGEGIVVKNYDWKNIYGRQPWAKIVRNEFKEENKRAFGSPEKRGSFQVEAAIAEEYVTSALVAKERAKVKYAIMEENGVTQNVELTHRGQIIPRLLQTVYHAVVTEEIWTAVRKYKDPTIDFNKLRKHVIHYTKKHAGDLF
ncbi:MAG: RNA ligase family protein [Halobacteriota archaeon]|nr:RNA ligase family protein [Halobacteriota archaeon]